MHTHTDDFSKAVDGIRLEAAQELCPEVKARLGQSCTPILRAQFEGAARQVCGSA